MDRKNLITIFISVTIALMVLEIGLRIYYWNDYSVPNHRNLLFKKVWGDKYVHLNSLGFREKEFQTSKAPGSFRILILGDSLTFGEGIRNVEHTYPRLLERKLNLLPGKRPFEVLNLSKPGFNVSDYIETLKNTGLFLEPDLVVIGFYINDIEDGLSFYCLEDCKKDRPKYHFLPDPVHIALSKISFTYHYANAGLAKLLIAEDFINYQLSYVNENSQAWKSFATQWKLLLDMCTHTGMKSLVLILPHNTEFSDSHPFLEVYDNVTALSEKYNADVLNLFPHFVGIKPQKMRVGVTDGHPNENAHRIFADAIYRFLVSHRELSAIDP